MQRLNIETWKSIFKDAEERNEEMVIEIETVYLDSEDEWCLCVGGDLWEDGFKTEQEAQERLNYIESLCR